MNRATELRLILRARGGDELAFQRLLRRYGGLINSLVSDYFVKGGLHRVICGLRKGDGQDVDHRNRDKLDNRRSNLRIIPRNHQPHNTGARSGAASAYRGVVRKGDRWGAQCTRGNGSCVYIGTYLTELDAAAAAAQWRSENLVYAIEDPKLLARHVERTPIGLKPSPYVRLSMGWLQASTTLSRRQIADLLGTTSSALTKQLGPGSKRKRICLHHEMPHAC